MSADFIPPELPSDTQARDAMTQALVEALAIQAANVYDAFVAGDPEAPAHQQALMARIYALDNAAARDALGTVLFMLAAGDDE